MLTSRNAAIAAFLLCLVAFVVAAHPNLFHYDDFAYLYAARNYPLAELLDGRFEPSNVPGFFNAKIGHVALLKVIVAIFGGAPSVIWIAQAIYGVLIVATSLLLCAFMRVLHRTSIELSLCAAALFLLSPIPIYLAGKLLSEGPAIFWGMISLVLLALSLRSERPGARALLVVLAALTLVACLCTRINYVLLPLAAWLALLLAPPESISRRRVLLTTAATGIIAVAVVVGLEEILRLDLLRGMKTASVIATQTTDLQMKLMLILFAFGPLVIAAPASLLLWKDRTVRFHLLWCAIASLPMLMEFTYFETRWLYVGVPALCALVVFCIVRLWNPRWLQAGGLLPAWRGALVTLTFGAALFANAYIQPRTEVGFDSRNFEAARAWIDAHFPGGSLLIPWHWSDYHYIRVAHPEARAYLVNSWTYFDPPTVIEDQASWTAALHRWYGDRSIADLAELRRTARPPWIVVAWNRGPGSWNAYDWTWIRHAPELRSTLVNRVGLYNVYLIEDVSTDPGNR
jgi:hypothetical protein